MPKEGYTADRTQDEATFVTYMLGRKEAIIKLTGGSLRVTGLADIIPRSRDLVVRRVRFNEVVDTPKEETEADRRERKARDRHREPRDRGGTAT
jgi:hypothetical protein